MPSKKPSLPRKKNRLVRAPTAPEPQMSTPDIPESSEDVELVEETATEEETPPRKRTKTGTKEKSKKGKSTSQSKKEKSKKEKSKKTAPEEKDAPEEKSKKTAPEEKSKKDASKEKDAPEEKSKKSTGRKRTKSASKTKAPPKRASSRPAAKKVAPEIKKTRGPRQQVTIENYTAIIRDMLGILEEEIVNKRNNRRIFKTLRRHAKDLLSRAPRLAHQKRRQTVRTGGSKSSGFRMEKKISDQMAKFLEVEPGTKVSRTDVTRAICVYIHLNPDETRPEMLKWKHLNPNGRDLRDPNSKKIILPDQTLAQLVGYDQYKKDVEAGKVTMNKVDPYTRVKTEVTMTDPSLRFWVIQRLIQHHFV